MAVGVGGSHSEHSGSLLPLVGDTTDSRNVRHIAGRDIGATCYIIAAIGGAVFVLVSQPCYRRMVKAIPQCLHEFSCDAVT